MKHTLVEKLLLHSSGNSDIEQNELIRVQPNCIPSSHYSINSTIRSFKRSGMKHLAKKENIILINNASPVDSATQSTDTYLLQKFVKDFDLENYFELGRSGFPGVVLIEIFKYYIVFCFTHMFCLKWISKFCRFCRFFYKIVYVSLFHTNDHSAFSSSKLIWS